MLTYAHTTSHYITPLHLTLPHITSHYLIPLHTAPDITLGILHFSTPFVIFCKAFSQWLSFKFSTLFMILLEKDPRFLQVGLFTIILNLMIIAWFVQSGNFKQGISLLLLQVAVMDFLAGILIVFYPGYPAKKLKLSQMTPSRGWWPRSAGSARSQYPYYIVVSVNLRIFLVLGTLYPRYHCSDGSKVFALREKGGTLWGWLYFPKHPRRYQIPSNVCTLFAFQSTRLHDHRYNSTRQ